MGKRLAVTVRRQNSYWHATALALTEFVTYQEVHGAVFNAAS